MKKIRKFLKETKTGGVLGAKRRQQMKWMAVCFGIFALAFVLISAGAFEFGAKSLFCIAVLPAIAGVDLSAYVKKNEELNDDEKATIATIQKALNDTLHAALKGVITEEEMQNRLNGITEQINKSNQEATAAMQTKYDEALSIIETMRTDLNGLQDDLKEAKEKLSKKEANNTMKDALSKAFDSDRYKALVNGTSKSTGAFDMDFKSLRKKGVVDVTNDYSGTVYTALRTDIMTNEVELVRPHMRDFMRVIDITDEEVTNVYFRQIYDIDRAALAVSENGRLPEGSFKVREANAETHRIGWHIFVSRRMLRKIALIQNRILTLMPSGMARQEDFQFLYGDNNDANFNGIVKQAITESSLNGAVYTESAAGKVKSIASYDSGASVLVTLNGPYAKIETGMKVVFSGFQTCTALNAATGFEIKVLNDHQFVVPCTYTAETDASVLANAKFTITNSFAGLVTDANIGDAIRAIVSYLEFDIYRPTMIVVNPLTMTSFIAQKDGNGRPMWNEYLQIRNGVYYFDGIIPIVTCDAIAKGKVLVGDFINAAELYDTQRGYVEFAEDVETKLTNEVCVLIQEEVILAVSCPEAFMYADIANVVNIINVEGAPKKVVIAGPLNADEDAVLMQAKS